jgi:hypothetical protein
VRNHARAVLACDFFAIVTATFRVCYVFVVLGVETRQILHWNVTAHPTAEWTTQQFRMTVSREQPYRLVISRPRHHLHRSRRPYYRYAGSNGAQDAREGASSERSLRAVDRHDSARVPRLGNFMQ